MGAIVPSHKASIFASCASTEYAAADLGTNRTTTIAMTAALTTCLMPAQFMGSFAEHQANIGSLYMFPAVSQSKRWKGQITYDADVTRAA
jgi:hypothetical protein